MNTFVHKMSWDANKIVSPCTIDVGRYARKGNSNENVIEANALWDTGATVTVVSELMVHRLGLVPTDFMKVAGYDGRTQIRNVYKIDLAFSDSMRFVKLNVIDAPLITTDILLGMDVIAQGDLMFVHDENQKRLSFSIKSEQPNNT
ncbi:MAG: retroviral-like aspartic protease family protein [Prevotella sp.]|nr:retroviral-like aspartic protease family protein [Candidatus Prevotella equi]